MKVYIGADHRGFKLKEELKIWLIEKKNTVEDVGAFEYDSDDDYPLFAEQVAKNVAADFDRNIKDTRGILICGSGAGVSIVANKFKHIRSALAVNKEQIRRARLDDDINVLSIAADYTNEDKAKEIVKAFIETEFEPSEKHTRRLKEIEEIKNVNRK